MKFIDNFLNNITMYRLVLYYLIALLVIAAIFSFLGILPFTIYSLIISTLFLTLICWATNTLFANVFKAQTNIESVYITALILALIISPIKNPSDFIFLGWAAILAIASKYIFTINKKHIFNPAAFAVVLTAIAINQSASWWIGTSSMMPFVLIGGLLLIRKIKRHDLVMGFFYTSLLTIFVFSFFDQTNLLAVTKRIFFDSPILFFAFIMLTEPLTTPPTKSLQTFYGAFVGFLFAPQIHLGSLYSTPELALIIGNVFSYLVSPKTKLILKLKEKIKIAPDIYDFIFATNNLVPFKPGQYMEWTLAHERTDNRGSRRYFTIASSPTEYNVRIGVKFYEKSSTFKKSLLAMDDKSEIIASQLAGDFLLPKNVNQKLIFIAGGIGITPFRSMIKFLMDKKEKRDIVLFYANKNSSDIVYKDVFEQAERTLGIKTIYSLSDLTQIPLDWTGKTGRINKQMIAQEVPDFKERTFYLSGPRSLITGFEEVLNEMGVRKGQIKTDFFPGFM